jgi:hypothetical protein
MAGVYCPTCESVVSSAATYCLACGHDMTVQGPITSTGHDLNQLKDVVRMRDDLSMAEKFDLIAKVEEGANPILLGIAAPADGEDVEDHASTESAAPRTLDGPSAGWGRSTAARAAAEEVARSSRAMRLVEDGTIDRASGAFHAAMDRGLAAAARIHAVASGTEAGSNPEAMSEVKVLEPPKRSFCPKCGSDIHSMALHQWGKWRGMADDVLLLQLEAAMEAALVEFAGQHGSSDSTASKVDVDALRAEIEAEVRASMKAEGKDGAEASSAASSKTTQAAKSPAEGPATKASIAKDSPPKQEEKETKAAAPAKKPSLFGSKRPKASYDGPPEGKGEWFLENALDTIYDPHGTGKVLKPNTILARSSDGNVRVSDVVHGYAAEGEAGVSELAKTSPLTKYIIEAYDAC